MGNFKNIDFRYVLIGLKGQDKVTPKYVVIMAVSIVSSIILNYCGSLLAERIILPLYLDSIMTLFVTACFGLIPGLLCAIGSNLMLTVFVDSSFAFVICHILTVIFAFLIFCFIACSDGFKGIFTIHPFLWAALLSAVSNAILGNIIVDFVFASVTGRPHADVIVQCIFSAVPNRIFATYFAGFIQNLTDKVISACISFGAYRIVMMIKE